MKKIHYLKDEAQPKPKEDLEPIIWVYRWGNKFRTSPAFVALIEFYYFEN